MARGGRLAWTAVWCGVVGVAGQGVESCVFPLPDGTVYDLSELQGRVYNVPSVDGKFHFQLTMCRPLPAMPEVCTRQHPSASRSTAVQLTAHGHECYYLDRVDSVAYHASDPAAPQLGLDIVYGDGQLCGKRQPRELRLHFVCAPGYDATRPPRFVIEAEGCHYNVSWPSMHACPRRTWLGRVVGEGAAAAMAPVLWWSTLAWYGGLALYCLCGCTWNVWSGHADGIGWSAAPHRVWWEERLVRWTPARLRTAACWSWPGVAHVTSLLAVMASIVTKLWTWAIVSLRQRLRRSDGTGRTSSGPTATRDKGRRPAAAAAAESGTAMFGRAGVAAGRGVGGEGGSFGDESPAHSTGTDVFDATPPYNHDPRSPTTSVGDGSNGSGSSRSSAVGSRGGGSHRWAHATAEREAAVARAIDTVLQRVDGGL